MPTSDDSGSVKFDPTKTDFLNPLTKLKPTNGATVSKVPTYLAKPAVSSTPKKGDKKYFGNVQKTWDGNSWESTQNGPFVSKPNSVPKKKEQSKGFYPKKDILGSDTLVLQPTTAQQVITKKPINGTNSIQMIGGKEVLTTYIDGQWFRAAGPTAQPKKVHKGDMRYASNGQLERWDGNSWEIKGVNKPTKASDANRQSTGVSIAPKQTTKVAVDTTNSGSKQNVANEKVTLNNGTKKSNKPQGFEAMYGDTETAQKALYASIDARMKDKPDTIREFGTRGTPGYYVEIKTKDGWVGVNNTKAIDKLAKYAPTKEVAAALPAIATGTATATVVQTNPVEASQLVGVQQAEKANFAAAKPISADIDLGEAAKKSQAIIAAADMNSDGKLAKPEVALYNPADRNGNGKIGAKEANKFVTAADTNKSGVISAEESNAYAVLDTNNNGKLGKKEYAAYKEIDANGDGDITSEEAQQAYNAPVNSKQDKRTRQLAKEFLDINIGKSGAQVVDAQIAALAGVQAQAVTQAPASPATDAVMPPPVVIAPSVEVAAPAAVIAAADRNDNGVVGASEQAKFEALADADASGEVSTAEAQAFALIDSNENGKIGKKELAAFRAIDKNGDGNLTTKEAKAALKAQIDGVQDKRTHDLAKDYLAKNPGNGGGSDEVDAAAAALVNAGRTESSLKKEAAPAKKSKK